MTDNKTDKIEEPIASYGTSYTYADYLKFQYEEMVELIRGKIYKMSAAPRKNHQLISMALSNVIYNYLENKPCQVFAAPFDVILPVRNQAKNKATTVIQPDICVICDENKLDDAGCFGAPDWIIEIISPATSKKDLNDKYSIYEEAGVNEYWIVFPLEQIISKYILKNKKYERTESYIPEDIISPDLFPELKIEVEKIFPDK